jgi:hypothetical protein
MIIAAWPKPGEISGDQKGSSRQWPHPFRKLTNILVRDIQYTSLILRSKENDMESSVPRSRSLWKILTNLSLFGYALCQHAK